MADSRLTTRLAALPVAVLLTLGGAPPDARAEICQNLKPKKGCVVSTDVENQSLGKSEIKDEAGFKSSAGNSSGNGDVLGPSDKVVDAVSLKAPRNGWAIATATIELILAKPNANASVRCEMIARQGGRGVIAGKPFYQSLVSEMGNARTSLAVTLGFKVMKGFVSLKLSCRRLSGGSVVIIDSEINVQYYPTRYRAPR